MNIENFINCLEVKDSFFTGIPDSQLKSLCNYLQINYGISQNHIIGANEGNCTAIAAGYYMATGKVPVVYLQNSGIGNITNPATSLLHPKVYGIPCVFIVGLRGDPEFKDEPQHVFQGEITVKLLNALDISTFVVSKDTTENELKIKMQEFRTLLDLRKSVAFVIKKDALQYENKVKYANKNIIIRENAIEEIVKVSDQDLLITTTGKTSRELYEIREKYNKSHKYDFLTVGSMGHASGIALGLAINKPNTKVWCIDGDGAILMHMGSMAIIGANNPANLIHVLLNNESHETVGGMPTVSDNIDFLQIASACGYKFVFIVKNDNDLPSILKEAKKCSGLCFVEIKVSILSRANLGRPATSARENMANFMKYIKEIN